MSLDKAIEHGTNMEFTIKVEPFSWNDNFSEVALEDFSMVQKKLPYGIGQSIGMARSGEIRDLEIDSDILNRAVQNTAKMIKDMIEVKEI